VHHFSYIIQYIKKYLLLRCSKVLTLLQFVVKFLYRKHNCAGKEFD